jgi:hypothetical protein
VVRFYARESYFSLLLIVKIGSETHPFKRYRKLFFFWGTKSVEHEVDCLPPRSPVVENQSRYISASKHAISSHTGTTSPCVVQIKRR